MSSGLGTPDGSGRGAPTPAARAAAFCERFGLRVPVLLAPMAGVDAPSLSIAVGRAGGMGGCGALQMTPAAILDWCRTVRAGGADRFQVNLWVPDPPPLRDAGHEARVRAFLERWGPAVPPDAGDRHPPDFDAQCRALLDAKPAAASSVMGLFPSAFVAQLKAAGIAWIATASTVAEARRADAAGADVIAVQGAEAGGHRAAFDARGAEERMVGLMSLVPAVVDAVRVPVVAAGGVADGRGVAAALALGASAVQVGTAFLRCPEAGISAAWADALGRAAPEDTIVTRVFSGRPGRALSTAYVHATDAADAPAPAPYPVQRGLTLAMRTDAAKRGDVERMQAWAGQSAAIGRPMPAAELTARLWDDGRALLGGAA